MKVAICDNDQIFLNTFSRQVRDVAGVEIVEIYSDYEVFLSDLSANYDLVFMDMDWEAEKNGIDIAARVREEYAGTNIIFVTSYLDKFIEEVFLQKTNIKGILNKPVKQDVLETYIRKIEKELLENQKEVLVVKENNRRITIPASEIVFLESQNHMVKIVTAKDEYHVYEPLSELQKRLPAWLCRCHRGFIINFKYVQEIGKKDVVLGDFPPIPIGRNWRAEVEEKYLEYLKRKL